MIEFLLQPFAYEFMVRALVVTVLAAVVCAVLSCWLVLVGWSLMGDAVAHSVLPGVVLAYLIGAPFALGAVAFGGLAVALIGTVRGPRVREDAAIGIVFTTLFALGLVLVSITPSQIDLAHVVFGNVLGISGSDLAQVAAIGALVLAVALTKRRDLTLYAFDPTHAHALGLRPRRLAALLLGLLALTTVVALQVVGVVLVVAMLIIPGATARLLTDRFGTMLALAPAVAALAAVVGIELAYHADWAPGATVVLVQGAGFALAFLAAPRHGLVARLRARRSPTPRPSPLPGRPHPPARRRSRPAPARSP